MGLKNLPARSTLADALKLRDWRMYHELTMRTHGAKAKGVFKEA